MGFDFRSRLGRRICKLIGLFLARRSERRYAERGGMIRTDQNVEDTKYTTIHATKADNETAIHELGHNLGLLDVGARMDYGRNR